MKLLLSLVALLISCSSSGLSVSRGDAATEVGRLSDSNASDSINSDLVLATLDARQIQDAPMVADVHVELDIGVDGPQIPCKPAGYQYPDSELCWMDTVPSNPCSSYGNPDCKNGYLHCLAGYIFSSRCTVIRGWPTSRACSNEYPEFYKEITYCLGNSPTGEPCKGQRFQGYCENYRFLCPENTLDTSSCLQTYNIESGPWKFDAGVISRDAPVVDASKDSFPDLSSFVVDGSTDISLNGGLGN